MAQSNLPVLSAEGGLSRYLQEIRKFPMLEPDEEFMLAKRYKEHEDPAAAQKLITSHLRLVAKIAMGYRGYGLPISEVISEGNVGLMHAVKRFEPDKGFRLATYAMWWIRAAIQEYVLRSWSLVKIGTTAAQKRLFFNLRKVKGQIAALDDGNLHPEHIKQIATTLNVTEADVVSMNQRLTGDASLNAPMRADEGASEWQDWLVDDTPDQETVLGDSEEYDERMGLPQWADLGIYLQSLMLLAVHHGLATCAQGFWRRYAGTLQRQLALPEPYHVACGVALGYEDEAAPINALRSTRAPWADWGELRGFA